MKSNASQSLLKTSIILLFMLFAVDFFGIGWYIFGVTFILMVLFLFMRRKDVIIDSQLAWIAMLAVSNFLTIFYHSNGSLVTMVIKYLFCPIGGYIIGYSFSSETENRSDILKLYMYAVIPYFIHGVLNLIVFPGFSDFQRELPDFWTGEMWKATLACTYFAMTVPLCFIALITKGAWKKIGYFFLTAVSVYATVVTASRTVIYIGVIVIAFEFILYMSQEDSPIKKSRMVLGFSVLILIATSWIILNMDSLSSTDLFSRMTSSDMSEEPRIQLFKNVIDNFWAYPFGNMPYFYSHNTWLDFLRISGWIPFLCFAAITVISIKHMLLIYRDKSLSLEDRIAVTGMMTALFADMFVEPMMDGAAILFCLFFYFLGINSYYAKSSKWRKLNV